MSWISRLFDFKAGGHQPEPGPKPVAPAVSAPAVRGLMKFSAEATALFKKPIHIAQGPNPLFRAAAPPPGVLPKGQVLAMDSAYGDVMSWANDASGALAGEGQLFLGYPELSVLAQRAEYRSIVETFAVEMTRKWIKFIHAGQDLDASDEEDQPGENDEDGDGEIDPLEPVDEEDGEEATLEGNENPFAEKEPADAAEDADPGIGKRLADALNPEGAEEQDAQLQEMQEEQQAQEEADKAAKKQRLQEKADKKSKVTAKLRAMDDEFVRLGIRDAIRRVIEHDGFFGRAHLYIDVDNAWNYPEELAFPIGSGSDATSLTKVRPGLLTRIKVVEPVWCYPSAYNSNDPLHENWYKPGEWFILGKKVHASRLLTFISREVPDMLKPAYSFGGLSLIQIAKPYVDNWLRTRQSVSDIVHSFSVFVLKTNMRNVLAGGAGEDLLNRLDTFTSMRDNTGVMALDKDDEDFSNVAAPISGLDKLLAQSQEQCASVVKIPLVKYTGISPSGLNASSDGELRCFNDETHSKQEALLRPGLTALHQFVQLNLFGEVDPEIDFKFLPLYELTEKEEAEVQKIKADTAGVLIDHGVIAPEEERQRIIDDDDSPYQNLDPAELPDLAQEEEDGLKPKGGGSGGEPGGEPGGDAEGGDSSALDAMFDANMAAHDEARAAFHAMAADEFVPAHAPAGTSEGGQFVSQGGGSSGSTKAAPAEGSFNAAMQKMSKLPKKDKQAFHALMHHMLGNHDHQGGAQTFSDAMKQLASKSASEKKKFAAELNGILDNNYDVHATLAEVKSQHEASKAPKPAQSSAAASNVSLGESYGFTPHYQDDGSGVTKMLDSDGDMIEIDNDSGHWAFIDAGDDHASVTGKTAAELQNQIMYAKNIEEPTSQNSGTGAVNIMPIVDDPEPAAASVGAGKESAKQTTDDAISTHGFKMQDNYGSFNTLKKGDSTLHVEKATGNWQLVTAGFQTKIGNGSAALNALMSGDKPKWLEAGVKVGKRAAVPGAKPAKAQAATPVADPHDDAVESAKAGKKAIEKWVSAYEKEGYEPKTAKAMGVIAAMLEEHGSSGGEEAEGYVTGAGKHYADTLGSGLTPEQGGALAAYVGSHYAKVSKQLWRGSITPQEWAYAKLLTTALNKLPNHVGAVTRGISSDTIDWDSYEVGKMKEERGFSSAGLKKKLWGDTTFKIKSKTGKSIAAVNSEGGGEVIFRMGTRFLVTKKDKATKTIWMEEDDDDFDE